jgi:uncharacterized protein
MLQIVEGGTIRALFALQSPLAMTQNTPAPPAFEFNATVQSLFVYPVKSCAGVQVNEAILTETGLEFDRAWMVVDDSGEFVTQRELPRMSLIQPTLKHYDMVLRAPGMLALHIALNAVEQPCRATVWGQDCAAYDMGDVAAQWFTDFLAQDLPAGMLAKKLRMVRFDPEHPRLSNKQWTHDVEALNQFSDGYPILVLSESAIAELNTRLAAQGHVPVTVQRFRPNIVLSGIQAHDEDHVASLHITTAEGDVELALVKPCPRCPIPNVNPLTAIPSPEVGDTLQSYRQDARLDGAVTFGMNAITIQGFEHVLKVGQTVGANYAI